MIKAIIFDVDGVLIDSLEANAKFFQDLMQKAGYKAPTHKEYTAIFHLSMIDVIKHLTKSTSEKEIQRIWDMGESRDVEYPVDFIKMPEGSDEVIKTLSKKYLLGIVTNRVRNGVFEIPQLAKLKRYFKAVVAYEDTINHKPHPEPLLLAVKKLNVKPSETIYIGDANSDVQAAKAAGTQIITYPKLLDGVEVFISSFKQLPKVVESKKF